MSLSRRELLAAAGAGVVVVQGRWAPTAAAANRVPLFRSGRFVEGVQSGDPKPTSIAVLTRLADAEGRGSAVLEIARDRGFDRVVVRARVATNPSLGHAIKARVDGLKPHEDYWYRFSTRNQHSPVGHFRTSPPPGSRQPIRFGILTGLDFTAGYFNALRRIADEDLDFVLNLGNYICADYGFTKPSGVRDLERKATATTLGAYRDRYREYRRRDGGLRAMHAAHALVSTWGDREVASGYAGNGSAEGPHRSAFAPAAHRAWFESMPHYPKSPRTAQVHHRAAFGRLLDVLVLDTRRYRTDPSCLPASDEYYCVPGASENGLLGRDQSRFLLRSLTRSRAAWKIIAGEAPIAFLRDDSAAVASDGWDRYPLDRAAVLTTIQGGVDDVVFASAGRRRFVASDVLDGEGRIAAAEFVCGTVSESTEAELRAAVGSEGYGTIDQVTEPPQLAGQLRAANPELREHDQLHHGYAVCSVTREALTMRFRKLATVRSPTSALDPGSVHRLERGRRGLA